MKKTGDFYGNPIQKGLLHKKMDIPQGKKLPVSRLRAMLAVLKNKKHRTRADIKKLREILFALNAHKFKH